MVRYLASMSAVSHVKSNEWLNEFRTAVRHWYKKSGRDLPWRGESDPYRVWIREVMLQQTTVVAVVPYLERFLTAFPRVETLATASEEEVLKQWEGLGYYSRARNLHRAAQQIVSDFDATFPDDASDIKSLPGIGRYTAGAIASFAFGRSAPIVEANTGRLYARLIGLREELSKSSSQRTLWEFAGQIVPQRGAGRFNQALIDLGAVVCRPKDPDCNSCPLASMCTAFRLQDVDTIPLPKKRPEITRLSEAYVAVQNDGHVLLRQRQDNEWWAGLWDFIRIPLQKIEPKLTARVRRLLETQVKDETGLDISLKKHMHRMSHSVTRYRIELMCYLADASREGNFSNTAATEADTKWVAISALEKVPLTQPARRFADILVSDGN